MRFRAVICPAAVAAAGALGHAVVLAVEADRLLDLRVPDVAIPDLATVERAFALVVGLAGFVAAGVAIRLAIGSRRPGADVRRATGALVLLSVAAAPLTFCVALTGLVAAGSLENSDEVRYIADPRPAVATAMLVTGAIAVGGAAVALVGLVRATRRVADPARAAGFPPG